jgi:anti-sigma factor RsiW
MNPIDPAELSALLDGELTPQRADEVRAAIQHDPSLKTEFERLRRLDAACREAAATAEFQPQVTIAPHTNDWSWAAPAGMGVILLVVRFLPKMWDLALLGAVLHVAAMAIVLWWIVRLVSQEEKRPTRWGRPLGFASCS